MLTLSKFSGINNVLPGERLLPDRKTGITALASAINVDIGLDNEVLRRRGYSQVAGVCHKNVWEANGFLLATVNGDLVARAPNGDETTIYPSLGVDRVWYMNLPDGRTTFSNGLINGITDGAALTGWGVPLPAGLGDLTPVSGSMFPGGYQYQLTHVRLSDGLEGGAVYSDTFDVPDGGIVLENLPVLSGYKTNVYLTGHNGGDGYLAGSTTTSMFAYSSGETRVLPCRTDWMFPAPVGTLSGFWRGRALVAEGDTLWASLYGRWELFDMRRDFKRFDSPITVLQPVDDGIFVGTTTELAFLAGKEFDKLEYGRLIEGRAVLGSGVTVRGELITRATSANGVGSGTAMLCIADGVIVAGFNDGGITRMTEGQYKTTVTEVVATFRMQNDIPQYIAIPQ